MVITAARSACVAGCAPERHHLVQIAWNYRSETAYLQPRNATGTSGSPIMGPRVQLYMIREWTE